MNGKVGGRGQKGRSGRKPISREQAYFHKLDAVLPEVVDFLIDTVRRGKNSVDKFDRELAIKAANILNSKAPQRIAGTGEGGELLIKVINDV